MAGVAAEMRARLAIAGFALALARRALHQVGSRKEAPKCRAKLSPI